MIYEFPDSSEPIRQGDIFFPIPTVAINLDEIPVINEDESIEEKKWEEISNFPASAALSLKKSWGIVASQDCDTSRAPTISFFIISPISELEDAEDHSKRITPKSWAKWITKKSKENSKRFYLPSDNVVGFSERMMVLFQDVIQIPRESLESRKNLRKGRLNEVADEHFRESIAQFFRRYPYNEWYPLNKAEFDEYQNTNDENIPPYPWQE